jgi:hypothetical protein
MLTVDDNVSSVFLDSAGLDVHKVDYQHKHSGRSHWEKVNFSVTTPSQFLGNAIEVQLLSPQPKNT